MLYLAHTEDGTGSRHRYDISYKGISRTGDPGCQPAE